MKFVLDENISRPIVEWLRSEGVDAIWIAEIAASADDPDVLRIAAGLGRTFVTFDVGIGPQARRRDTNPPAIAIIRVDMSSERAAFENFKLAWPHARRSLRPGVLVIANTHKARASPLPGFRKP